MPFQSLKEYLHHHRDLIFERMRGCWLQEPDSPYKDFILKTEEGQRRLRIWMSLLINVLGGNHEEFLKDQHRVGYDRAVKGLKLENVVKNIIFFMRSFWEILPEDLTRNQLQSPNLYKEIEELVALLFEDYEIMAASYVKTREELINEKFIQLDELFNFTREIITLSSLEDILNLLLKKTNILFGSEHSHIALYRNNYAQEVFSYPEKADIDSIRSIIEKTQREGVSFFMDEAGSIYKDIEQFKLKRVAAVPIKGSRRFDGILALANSVKGFRFMEKESNFLYQFIHITAVALENMFILEDIEQSRKELRFLTNKMINIQEQERRRLAGDIHDTLAQALTGISYKIQFCKELSKRNPELLNEQFDSLLNTVNHAIDQSRELISSLRPELIDTVGLVSAFKHHIDNFEQETGILVDAHLPAEIQISSELSICLFRVAQEALMNVYKHAETGTVELTLRKEDENLILVLADNGKGFDMSQGLPWIRDQNKMGLLYMKERVESLDGKLVIDTGINRGCRIEAKVPIDLKAGHHAED